MNSLFSPLRYLLWFLLLPIVAFSQGGISHYLTDGIQAYRTGDFEGAYQDFKLYEQYGGQTNKEFFVYFAMSAAKAGHEDAPDILRRGLKQFPGDADLSLLLAQFLAQNRQFDQAMRILKKAKEAIQPQEYRRLMAVLSFDQGVALYQKNQIKKSLPYFRQAVEWQPDEPRFVRNLAIVLWETGKRQKAIQLLEKALSRFPGDDQTNRLLIAFYQKSGDLLKLQNRLKETAQKTGKLSDYLALGKFYLLTGQEKKARTLFAKLEKNFSRSKDVYLARIRFYRNLFRYYQADSVLSRMEKRFPQDTLVCHLKAQNYEDMDSLKSAIIYWKKCLTQFPHKAEWHFRLLKDLQKTDSSAYVAHLSEMEKLLTDNASRFKIALEWFKSNHYSKALAIFKQLAEFDPDDGLKQTYIGLCLHHLGNDSLALSTLKKAITLKGVLPQAYFSLAHYAWQQGQQKQSELYFETGMEMLLNKIREAQTVALHSLKQNNLKTSDKQSVAIAESYWNAEQLMKQELRWYQTVHPAKQAETYLQSLLNRFPKNAFLRLLLAKLMIEQKNYEQAAKYLDDVLFMKPGNARALRLRINLAALQHNDLAVFRAYLNLLYHDFQHFTRHDYRQLIETARKTGQMKNLAQQLLLLHYRHPQDALLKQFTVEALHLAGDHVKARQVAAEKAKKSAIPAKQSFLPLIETQ